MSLLTNGSNIKTVKANNVEMYDVYAKNTLIYSKRVFTISQRWTYPNDHSTTITINKAPLVDVKLDSNVIMKAGSNTTTYTTSSRDSWWNLYYGSAVQQFYFTPSQSGNRGSSNTSTQTITLYGV